jgi:hypothetical protein
MALPEIANPTIAQLHDIVNENLANDVVGGIDPTDHRAVENSVVNFLANITGTTLKAKVVTLGTFAWDAFATVPTGIVDGTTIISVVPMLLCKADNNGWVVGDIVSPSTPYSAAGSHPDEGMAVKFNASVANVEVLISNQLQTLNKAGALVNNINAIPSQWSVRLTIFYV